jgi:hypothetical protein
MRRRALQRFTHCRHGPWDGRASCGCRCSEIVGEAATSRWENGSCRSRRIDPRRGAGGRRISSGCNVAPRDARLLTVGFHCERLGGRVLGARIGRAGAARAARNCTPAHGGEWRSRRPRRRRSLRVVQGRASCAGDERLALGRVGNLRCGATVMPSVRAGRRSFRSAPRRRCLDRHVAACSGFDAVSRWPLTTTARPPAASNRDSSPVTGARRLKCAASPRQLGRPGQWLGAVVLPGRRSRNGAYWIAQRNYRVVAPGVSSAHKCSTCAACDC